MDPVTILTWLAIIVVGGFIIVAVAQIAFGIWAARKARKAFKNPEQMLNTMMGNFSSVLDNINTEESLEAPSFRRDV